MRLLVRVCDFTKILKNAKADREVKPVCLCSGGQ